MISREDLTTFINQAIGDTLFAQALTHDDLANGIQIHGTHEVHRIALGVSCNLEFLNKAVRWQSDYCIFHHGIDMRVDQGLLPQYLQKRLQIIYQHNLTVAGYHYVLDAHPVIGNNSQIIHKLGAKITNTLFDDWGFTATFKTPKPLKSLLEDCVKLFGRKILHFGPDTDSPITTIGVVSGAAKPYAREINEMLAKSVDLFISGETSESSPHKLIESGIHYFVCGHYATEVFGVQALGTKIQYYFGNKVEVKFIDISNPI